MAGIELKDVSFAYGHNQVIDGLSLRIPNGERHAILGASGAGKTTLLNLLSGLLQPDSGEILFDGQDVQNMRPGERSLSQVFQFPVLYESLTVHENMLFALRNRGELDEESEAHVLEVVRDLGLTESLAKKPAALDLYQKQLVAVAKAIVRTDTQLVLLDEPLTAVDPKRKWQMRQVLKRVQQSLDLTMIYVTHDQTEAMAFADRVSILTTEGIVQTGSPEELYQQPATPFVGHFVGSPGMNFVPGSVVAAPEQVVGFREDWASLSAQNLSSADLNGTVVDVRLSHSIDSEHVGLVYIETGDGEIVVKGPAVAVGQEVGVRLARVARYEDDRLVSVDDR